MKIEIIEWSVINPDEGCLLRRKRDGALFDGPIHLGYNYRLAGVQLLEPYMETPDDFEDVPIPEGWEGTPDLLIDHHARLKAAIAIMKDETGRVSDYGLTDQQMLDVKTIIPIWGETEGFAIGDWVEAGKVVRFKPSGESDFRLYRVIQRHQILALNFPSVDTASLYMEIVDTKSDPTLGTIDNPIEYDGNMVLENGKYYKQNGVVYLCTRDSGNPVYHALADLVGHYVVVA